VYVRLIILEVTSLLAETRELKLLRVKTITESSSLSLAEYRDNIEDQVVFVTVDACVTQYGGESRKSRRRSSL
jgi:hypothetical protein